MAVGDPIAIPVDAILKEYDQSAVLNSAFVLELQRVISELLVAATIRVHSVSHRLKRRESLDAKLKRPDRAYNILGDVTDICGVRIITFFADDVDRVSGLIEKEFDVDKENSIDKRAALDPDRFGYVSVHYVVRLPSHRLKLTENKRFTKCRGEIQIRSVLQHVWAEIEHDLGYKSKQAVPRDLRRQFSRLAGLLEVADHEFMQIRNELNQYEESVKADISNAPDAVGLDGASLFAFIAQSERLAETDAPFARSGVPTEPAPDDIERALRYLSLAGFSSIGEIDSALAAHAEDVKRFSYFSSPRIFRGFSLFALAALTVLGRDGKSGMKSLWLGIGVEESKAEELATTAYDFYLSNYTARM